MTVTPPVMSARSKVLVSAVQAPEQGNNATSDHVSAVKDGVVCSL